MGACTSCSLYTRHGGTRRALYRESIDHELIELRATVYEIAKRMHVNDLNNEFDIDAC
jgi:hypothetical protein